MIASSEPPRHAWGAHSVTVVETGPGFVELRMTGYDVLRAARQRTALGLPDPDDEEAPPPAPRPLDLHRPRPHPR